MWAAKRVVDLPPNVFAEANRRLAALAAQGVDTINLGIGNPDLPTPPHIVEALATAAQDPANHRYPNHFGLPELRQAVADWYQRRFGVSLDPASEVLPLLGSKEGLAHAALAYLDPGDLALVTEPGYPTYAVGAMLAGAEVHWLPLRAERDFLPDLAGLPPPVRARAKVLWLNYPNNPTGAVAPLEFFEEAVEFGLAHDCLLLHDAAYTEVTFDGYRPASLLQVEAARRIGVEFHSLSKTYNMPGWRIGMAVGSPEALDALAKVKSQVDTGIFPAVQHAAVAALTGPQDWLHERNQVYQRRRDLVCAILERLGLRMVRPRAGMFVWARVPDGNDAEDFSLALLGQTGLYIPPGTAFGPSGEGYLRLSLTLEDDRLAEAMARLERFVA